MRDSVRYQVYASKDGMVLFQASERAFWKNFCEAVGRLELFEAHPGSEYGDHARGNTALQDELTTLFATRDTADWVTLGLESNVPLSPVHDAKTVVNDPQFEARLPLHPASALGAEQLPFPVRVDGALLPTPSKAPTPGQHTEEVLEELLGYDPAKIEQLRQIGAFGPPS